ncbi:MAG: glycosyltransferase family 2 protein [Blastochloris sp.]|nr:glycosyltransferase family 2 protein [Blastochloris sp.]
MISVIIPAYNRLEPLRATLASARAALPPTGEIILVDDGSSPPLNEQLPGTELIRVRLHRQANQGSMQARLSGLRLASQPYVLFLDSDDLIHPDKMIRQIDAMTSTGAEISTSDYALLSTPGDSPIYEPGDPLEHYENSAELFLRVQPAPHNPIYLRSYLQKALAKPRIPPQRCYDPVGDVWLYYNLVPYPARQIHVSRPFTATGIHAEERFSRHWEHLGLASLFLMEDALLACPLEDSQTRHWIGTAAFRSWRALPRDFHADFSSRTLDVWRRSGAPTSPHLGGTRFHQLARWVGPVWSARILKFLTGHTYASCRTLGDVQLDLWKESLRQRPAPFL